MFDLRPDVRGVRRQEWDHRAGTIEPAIPKLTPDVLYEVRLSARSINLQLVHEVTHRSTGAIHVPSVPYVHGTAPRLAEMSPPRARADLVYESRITMGSMNQVLSTKLAHWGAVLAFLIYGRREVKTVAVGCAFPA